MLRICHIISGDLWAGAEVMVYQLLKSLRAYNDLEILVILFNHGKLAEEIRNIGYKIYILDEKKNSFFQLFCAIRKILNNNNPSIIHSHRYKENILVCMIAKTIENVKLISTQHGMPETKGEKSAFTHRFILKCDFILLSRYFDKFVGVSDDIKKAFIDRRGFNKDKICVIHNGIDIPNIARKKYVRKDAFVIGSAGRLFPIKDYH